MNDFNRESDYKKALEMGYVVALIFVILLFICFKRYDVVVPTFRRLIASENFIVEDIPVTRQGIPRKRPQRPDVIIPVTEEVVPEDELIEDIEDLSLNQRPGLSGIQNGEGFSVEVLPRPIAEVFPEFPREALKAGVEGLVSLHLLINEKGIVTEIVLLENTTGNSHCVIAAKKAAMRNRFLPGKKSGKNVAMWIVKNYVFKSPK